MTNKSGLNLAIMAAINGDFRATDEIMAKMSRMERVLKSRKTHKREEKLGKPWNKATLQERAKFESKYVYDPKKKMYVRRDEPKDYNLILKELKQKSRLFKQRAHRMGKRAAQVKKTYSPIKTSVTLAASNYLGLSVDITNSDNPSQILTTLLSKTKVKNLSKDAIRSLHDYYSRPLSIDAYMINSTPFVLITEDDGLYTFEAPSNLLTTIKKSFIKATKSSGESPTFEYLTFEKSHVKFMRGVFSELGDSNVISMKSLAKKEAKKLLAMGV